MKEGFRLPIATFVFWALALAALAVGERIFLSGFFLMGWAAAYRQQRPSIVKNRKLYDVCYLVLIVLAILSMAHRIFELATN